MSDRACLDGEHGREEDEDEKGHQRHEHDAEGGGTGDRLDLHATKTSGGASVFRRRVGISAARPRDDQGTRNRTHVLD